MDVAKAYKWFTDQAKTKSDVAAECVDTIERRRLRKQVRLYKDLADTCVGAYHDMASFRQSLNSERISGRVSSDPENNSYDEYAKHMIAARIAGLGTDPFVHEWFINQHGYGNRTYLRQARRGWEKGIVPPLPLYKPHFRRIMTCRDQGLSWRSIHAILMRNKLIKPQSWENFRQWLTRQDLQALFPKGEKFQKPN